MPVAIFEIKTELVTVDVAFKLAELTLPVTVIELLAELNVNAELPARMPLSLYCTVVVTPPAIPPPPPPVPPVNEVAIAFGVFVYANPVPSTGKLLPADSYNSTLPVVGKLVAN